MAAVGEGAAVLVTGATGFVGGAVCRRLVAEGYRVVAGTRRPYGKLPEGVRRLWVPQIDAAFPWRDHLAGIDAVVHLAAPAHVTGEVSDRLAEQFHAVNVEGTETLAQAARDCGVGRLIFVSTVKVNGEHTGERPFTEDDPPNPQDPYARSKWLAEQRLRAIGAEGGLDVVVLRPPLVHGSGAKGNLLSLMRLCDTGLPLPFGGVRNRRSLIHAGNLADAVLTCLRRPEAAGRTWLLRDGRDLSSGELVAILRRLLGRPARLVAVPPALLDLVLGANRSTRLLRSLAVDDSRIRAELGWAPPCAVEEGLAEMVETFRRPAAAAGQVFDRRDEAEGVSVIMVSYNNDEIGPVLDSALAEPVSELVLVDNGNGPAARAEIARRAEAEPRLRVVSGHGNVGFATGCNIGVALARHRFVLLLNPDCYLEPGTVRRLTGHLGHRPGAWVAGARLVNHDGSEQRGTRRNFGSPLQWLVEALCLDLPMDVGWLERVNLHQRPLPAEVTPVPAISGAFMFMPRRAYEDLGGMDQRYFLHFEDLDFCIRMTRSGGTVLFCPDVTLVHRKSQSRASPLFVELHKCRSMRIYFREHFAAGHSGLVRNAAWLLLSAGLLGRAVLRGLRQGRRA